MQSIKDFLKSAKFEAFLWMTLNGFIGVLAVYLTDMNWAYAPAIVSILNIITKYINTRYIKK